MSAEFDHHCLDPVLADWMHAPRWWVAFSGGLDSSVLLDLLVRWRAANPGGPPLGALHVDHRLQAGAQEWAAHCRATCQSLDVPCRVVEASVAPAGHGLEAAARQARYACFTAGLGEGEVLFQAHHLDDQVETFFLRLLRGAGVQGLAGMPVSRALGRGWIVRPLLDRERGELERYALAHGLGWVEDPSNADAGLDRNFLRREVLPLLGSRWPGYRRTVARAAAHLRDAARALTDADGPPSPCWSPLGDPGLALGDLAAVDDATAARRLRAWLRSGGCASPPRAALAEFIRQLRSAGADAAPQLATVEYRLQRFRDGVYLLPPERPLPAEAVPLAPGEWRDLPGVGRIALLPVEAGGFALGAAELPVLRWRSGGETCHLAGRGGGASLKKLLQEGGIPPWWRDRAPLLYLDDELLAVGGLGACRGSRWRNRAGDGERCWALHWQPAVAGGFD